MQSVEIKELFLSVYLAIKYMSNATKKQKV